MNSRQRVIVDLLKQFPNAFFVFSNGLTSREAVPVNQKFFAKLEDIVLNKDILKDLFNFIGAKYENEIYTLIQTPYNVNKPVDTLLDNSKINILNQVAGDILKRYGYENAIEYKMSYLFNNINESLNEQ